MRSFKQYTPKIAWTFTILVMCYIASFISISNDNSNIGAKGSPIIYPVNNNKALPPGHPGLCNDWKGAPPTTPHEIMHAYAGVYKISCTADPPACTPHTGPNPQPLSGIPGWIQFRWDQTADCVWDEPVLGGVHRIEINGIESSDGGQYGYPNTIPDGGCGRNFGWDGGGYSYYHYVADSGPGVIKIYPVNVGHSTSSWLKYEYEYAYVQDDPTPPWGGGNRNMLILEDVTLVDGNYDDPFGELMPLRCSARRIWDPDLYLDPAEWTGNPYYYYVFFENDFIQGGEMRQ